MNMPRTEQITDLVIIAIIIIIVGFITSIIIWFKEKWKK
jgi:hypothetical protein